MPEADAHAQRQLELETRVALLESDNERLRRELAESRTDAVATACPPQEEAPPAPRPAVREEAAESGPRPVLRLYGPLPRADTAQAGAEPPSSAGFAVPTYASGLPSLGVVTRPGLSPPTAVREDVQMTPGYRRALELLSARNFAAALPLLDAFVENEPRHAHADNALLWKGDALVALGRHREAIVAYQRLLRDYPDSPLRARATQRAEEARNAVGVAAAARM